MKVSQTGLRRHSSGENVSRSRFKMRIFKDKARGIRGGGGYRDPASEGPGVSSRSRRGWEWGKVLSSGFAYIVYHRGCRE